MDLKIENDHFDLDHFDHAEVKENGTMVSYQISSGCSGLS